MRKHPLPWSVIPANAGIHFSLFIGMGCDSQIPAFAGMTTKQTFHTSSFAGMTLFRGNPILIACD